MATDKINVKLLLTSDLKDLQASEIKAKEASKPHAQENVFNSQKPEKSDFQTVEPSNSLILNEYNIDITKPLVITKEIRNKMKAKGEKGFFESLKDGAKNAIPFVSGIMDIINSTQLLNIVRKQKKGEKLTKEETEKLYEYMLKQVEEEERGSTFMGKVGSMLSHLPAFAGEFLVTGGIYSFGKNLAAKTITKGLQSATRKTLGKYVVKGAVEAMAGSAMRTIALPHMVVNNYVQRRLTTRSFMDGQENLYISMNENKENEFKTGIKALTDSYIEVLSEQSGEGFEFFGKLWGNKLLRKAAKTKFEPLIHKTLKSKPVRLMTKEATKKALARTGYNGIFAEYAEERFGGVLRSLTGTADENKTVTENLKDAIIPGFEQSGVELITSMLWGGTLHNVHSGMNKFTNSKIGAKTMLTLSDVEEKTTPLLQNYAPQIPLLFSSNLALDYIQNAVASTSSTLRGASLPAVLTTRIFGRNSKNTEKVNRMKEEFIQKHHKKIKIEKLKKVVGVLNPNVSDYQITLADMILSINPSFNTGILSSFLAGLSSPKVAKKELEWFTAKLEEKNVKQVGKKTVEVPKYDPKDLIVLLTGINQNPKIAEKQFIWLNQKLSENNRINTKFVLSLFSNLKEDIVDIQLEWADKKLKEELKTDFKMVEAIVTSLKPGCVQEQLEWVDKKLQDKSIYDPKIVSTILSSVQPEQIKEQLEWVDKMLQTKLKFDYRVVKYIFPNTQEKNLNYQLRIIEKILDVYCDNLKKEDVVSFLKSIDPENAMANYLIINEAIDCLRNYVKFSLKEQGQDLKQINFEETIRRASKNLHFEKFIAQMGRTFSVIKNNNIEYVLNYLNDKKINYSAEYLLCLFDFISLIKPDLVKEQLEFVDEIHEKYPDIDSATICAFLHANKPELFNIQKEWLNKNLENQLVYDHEIIYCVLGNLVEEISEKQISWVDKTLAKYPDIHPENLYGILNSLKPEMIDKQLKWVDEKLKEKAYIENKIYKAVLYTLKPEIIDKQLSWVDKKLKENPKFDPYIVCSTLSTLTPQLIDIQLNWIEKQLNMNPDLDYGIIGNICDNLSEGIAQKQLDWVDRKMSEGYDSERLGAALSLMNSEFIDMQIKLADKLLEQDANVSASKLKKYLSDKKYLTLTSQEISLDLKSDDVNDRMFKTKNKVSKLLDKINDKNKQKIDFDNLEDENILIEMENIILDTEELFENETICKIFHFIKAQNEIPDEIRSFLIKFAKKLQDYRDKKSSLDEILKSTTVRNLLEYKEIRTKQAQLRKSAEDFYDLYVTTGNVPKNTSIPSNFAEFIFDLEGENKEDTVEYLMKLEEWFGSEKSKTNKLADFMNLFDIDGCVEKEIIKYYVENIYIKTNLSVVADSQNGRKENVTITARAKQAIYNKYKNYLLLIKFEKAAEKFAPARGSSGIKDFTHNTTRKEIKLKDEDDRIFNNNDGSYIFDIFDDKGEH